MSYKCLLGTQMVKTKFWGITRLRFAIRKILTIRVLFGVEYHVESGDIRTGLIFVLHLNSIFGLQYRASTRPRSQTFKIPLEKESRVGTPLCQNLVKTWFWFYLKTNVTCKPRYVFWQDMIQGKIQLKDMIDHGWKAWSFSLKYLIHLSYAKRTFKPV